MIDFESHLSTLLDDVADSVQPHLDADSIFVPTVSAQRRDAQRFRPRSLVAVAAAGLVVLGGSAYALARLTDEPRNSVTPAATLVPETTIEPTTSVVVPPTTSTIVSPIVEESVTTSMTTAVKEPRPTPAVAAEPVKPISHPTVPKPTEPTETKPTEPPMPAETKPTETKPTEPKPTETTGPPKTTEPPAVIEFKAKLGAAGLANDPMQQGFFGAAQPGSVIRVESQYGVAETSANGDGYWETTLTMLDVPPGTKVAVRITSNTSERVHEFALLRPGPAAPVIEFTATLGADGQANTPMTQGFYGTAQPGSAIRIVSDWGVAETTAGPDGKWEATLVMPDVPPGKTVGVRVKSNTSDRVHEFTLQRPGEAGPVVLPFTANAALTTTDHTPPFNEYWGKSTAGAVISITSDFGSTQVVANGEGKWSARLEFPGAPPGVTFNVHIASSASEAVFDFPLTPVAPGT